MWLEEALSSFLTFFLDLISRSFGLPISPNNHSADARSASNVSSISRTHVQNSLNRKAQYQRHGLQEQTQEPDVHYSNKSTTSVAIS